LSLSV
jgi:hypothetical protein